MDLSVRHSRPASGPWLQVREASRSAWAALGFAVLFLVVFVVPPFTPATFQPYPLLRWGDVLDFATPLVMLPAYWLILSLERPPSRRQMLAFTLLGAAWVQGQSIHLAANAVGHLVTSGPEAQLASFFDETLSHLIWHGAAIALSALVVSGALTGAGSIRRSSIAISVAAAVVYGFGFFLIAVEGQTAALAVPGGALVAAVALRRGPREMAAHPVAASLGAGYIVMVALLAVWFVYWGGTLPEFSTLGLIK